MVQVLAIVIVILVIVILAIIMLYNSVIRLSNEVENSFSQIDVQLKRRNDLIPNLIESVKGYMKHEKTVLENITKARSAIMTSSNINEKAKASNQISQALKTIFAVSENYPKLRANENFIQLQEELTGTENKVSYSRQHYNDVVMKFNNKIQVFPNNVFASMLNFKEKELFQAAESERKNIKVQF